jgi:hypothetical protein
MSARPKIRLLPHFNFGILFQTCFGFGYCQIVILDLFYSLRPYLKLMSYAVQVNLDTLNTPWNTHSQSPS